MAPESTFGMYGWFTSAETTYHVGCGLFEESMLTKPFAPEGVPLSYLQSIKQTSKAYKLVEVKVGISKNIIGGAIPPHNKLWGILALRR